MQPDPHTMRHPSFEMPCIAANLNHWLGAYDRERAREWSASPACTSRVAGLRSRLIRQRRARSMHACKQQQHVVAYITGTCEQTISNNMCSVRSKHWICHAYMHCRPCAITTVRFSYIVGLFGRYVVLFLLHENETSVRSGLTCCCCCLCRLCSFAVAAVQPENTHTPEQQETERFCP